MERLWTPWRMRYVSGEARDASCIFCSRPEHDDDVRHLILHRAGHAYVIMNLYPYNSGHVMVVPYQHAPDLADLPTHVNRDLWDLVPWVTTALKRVLNCDGFNIGLNLGEVSGAGVSEHLHIHVVPRWVGDANFMPVLANTMVLPELIPITYAKIRAELELASRTDLEVDPVIGQAGAIPVIPSRGAVALRKTANGSVVLPKGHIESDEAAYQTAIREVDEEMGLVAEPAGWGGTLEFTYGDERRRVAHLILSAVPGTSFDRHLGHDTELYSPEEAVTALTHPPAKEMLEAALPAIHRLLQDGPPC